MRFASENRLGCLRMPAGTDPFDRHDPNGDDPLLLGYVERHGIGLVPVGCTAEDVHTLPMLRARRLLGWVCRERAPLTALGQLRCNGRRLTPEAYLSRWREAMATAVPVAEAARRRRLQTVARFRWVAADSDLDLRAGWSDAPCPQFGELLEMVRSRGHRWSDTVRGPSQVVQAEIDLAGADGPRLAWWLNSWLSQRAFAQRVAYRFVAMSAAGGAARDADGMSAAASSAGSAAPAAATASGMPLLPNLAEEFPI